MTGDEPLPECQLAVVVSKYNHSITKKLLEGAIETLTSGGLPSSAIDVAWVPGAWEIPIVVQKLARSGHYAAILALGAVIRGETTHDQYINQQVSSGLSRISLDHQIPVLFGVLTCNSLEQAIHRSGGQAGNKGQECAQAALDVVKLLSRLA
ncbi:MAG: 6,7-dimethyl-8-ribityllumazine synthase [Planctomycetaceae bacterium]|nr:6,7-dimethyl-8-ribityllumazine synthase [Planctomycetaceae bacterium]MBP63342.1 6,7-dimethyl-8-ribityllumazine synthase [Planctomycetaceae bacterium]